MRLVSRGLGICVGHWLWRRELDTSVRFFRLDRCVDTIVRAPDDYKSGCEQQAPHCFPVILIRASVAEPNPKVRSVVL